MGPIVGLAPHSQMNHFHQGNYISSRPMLENLHYSSLAFQPPNQQVTKNCLFSQNASQIPSFLCLHRYSPGHNVHHLILEGLTQLRGNLLSGFSL